MCLAIPGKVVRIDRGADAWRCAGRVAFGGVLKDVNLAYVPEVKPGDYVLVHVGFAIGIVDEAEARETLACFEKLGELEESA